MILRYLRIRVLCVVLLTAAMSFIAPAYGQGNTSGYIVGEVETAAGPVAGARVTVRNLDTGLVRTQVTGSDGRYRISALTVGRYEISATASGYTGWSVKAGVNVGEGTNVTLVMASEGEAIDEIVVTSVAVADIDVTQSETTTIITSIDIGRLPVPRDPNAIAFLAPGAVYGDSAFGNDANATAQHAGTGFGLAS